MHQVWLGPVGQEDGCGKWLGVGLKTGGVIMRVWLDEWECPCLEEGR